MPNRSEPCPESQICSLLARANRLDPIGSASTYKHYLILEMKPPWPRTFTQSKDFPKGFLELWKRVNRPCFSLPLYLIAPDPEYSREGYTRLLYLRRPKVPFATYDKNEFVVPDGQLTPLVTALLEQPVELPRFEHYRQESSQIRDLLICTHGEVDVCCAKFGYPLYQNLRHKYVAALQGQVRVWQVSHIVGHHLAPTLIDYPEGRYWGHLEPEVLETLVLRNGSVSALSRFYRGWCGLDSMFEQVAEREIFVREGWVWVDYLKASQVLEIDQAKTRAVVRIDFTTPDGSTVGAYNVTVEQSGSISTQWNSGSDYFKEVKQYCVRCLDKVL